MSTRDEQNEKTTDHDYDGIRELDNDLPVWWLAIFGGTIIFASIYYLHYEIAGGPSSNQEIAAAMKVVNDSRKDQQGYTEDQLTALFTPESIRRGRDVFAEKCAACHGPAGGGVIGPNLTDDAWIHGAGTRLDIYNVVSKGVTSMGMPAWGEMLDAQDVIAASAFVHSIENTNVAGGKPRQGLHGER